MEAESFAIVAGVVAVCIIVSALKWSTAMARRGRTMEDMFWAGGKHSV